jgi:hypothetical protein
VFFLAVPFANLGMVRIVWYETPAYNPARSREQGPSPAPRLSG